jgi:hypothetical protein
MSKATDLRRAAFAREYCIDHNGKQAAIRAGYSPKSAEVQASQLLRLPKVAALIAEGERKADQRAQLTADQIDTELQLIASDSKCKESDRLRAYELMLKYRGAFTEKVQHSGAVGVLALTGDQIARMTDEQLQAAKGLLAAIKGDDKA